MQRRCSVFASPCMPGFSVSRNGHFAVDDIEDVIARLRTYGAELVGKLEQYEDTYRLCYVRGPEGIIIGLAEQLG
jgi:predicted enzyme related to lactoylglutathione lyase